MRPNRNALSNWIRSRQASVICLVIVVLAVIVLSLTPRPDEILGRLSIYDKADHLAAYVAVGFFAIRSVGRRDTRSLVLSVAASAALGGLIEIIQPYFGRTKELADFLVDLGGAAVGATIAFFGVRKARAGTGR